MENKCIGLDANEIKSILREEIKANNITSSEGLIDIISKVIVINNEKIAEQLSK